jgi:hypothetical protein
MSTLVAGPWVGEFGYELFEWQAAVRQIALDGGYEHVIVASREGHACLYEDFCTEYRVINQDINPCEGRFTTAGTDLVGLTQETFRGIPYLRAVCPAERLRGRPQKFVKFGTANPDKAYDVVFHARHIQVTAEEDMVPGHKSIKESRNWSEDKWRELAGRLAQSGHTTACIGSPAASKAVPYAIDWRGAPLDEVTDVLAGSKLIVGPSSGPIHLATLCECTQVVWGSPHLELRYKETWNPFHTPVSFIPVDDSWDPAVKEIYEAIIWALCEHVD